MTYLRALQVVRLGVPEHEIDVPLQVIDAAVAMLPDAVLDLLEVHGLGDELVVVGQLPLGG